jgi:hypothetical protein
MKPLFTGKSLYVGNWLYSCLLSIPVEDRNLEKRTIPQEGDNLEKASRARAAGRGQNG